MAWTESNDGQVLASIYEANITRSPPIRSLEATSTPMASMDT